MEIGVRELKAKLSENLAKAAAGASMVVTDRGTPVARLVPLSESSRIERGVEAGWIEPARRTSLGKPLQLQAIRSVSEVIDEDRGA